MRAMCNAYFGLFMDMLRIFLEKNTTLQEKMVCLAENMALVQKKKRLRYKLFWAFGLPINFLYGCSLRQYKYFLIQLNVRFLIYIENKNQNSKW